MNRAILLNRNYFDLLDLVEDLLTTVKKEKTHLKYSLKPFECSCEFQILEQSAEVTAFLNKKPFQASNGMIIKLGDFPEFKDSKNTIYLRGWNKAEDLKVDTTRFIRNSVRDSKMQLVNDALRELVDAVKKGTYYGTPLAYVNPIAADKRYMHKM